MNTKFILVLVTIGATFSVISLPISIISYYGKINNIPPATGFDVSMLLISTLIMIYTFLDVFIDEIREVQQGVLKL